jgi:hypothetical protein
MPIQLLSPVEAFMDAIIDDHASADQSSNKALEMR